MKIASHELASANPRPAFVAKTMRDAGNGFKQTGVPALKPYGDALIIASDGLHQEQTLDNTRAMCIASGQYV